jgi:putative ABC transport system substrate-binding protein
MRTLGILAYDDSVLGDVTELRLTFERLGYTVHLEQLGRNLHSTEFGYFEEDSLLIWLGRCYNDSLRCQEIAAKYAQSGIDLIVAMKAPAVQAALDATADTSTPVVFSNVCDPVLEGLSVNSSGEGERLTGVCDSWLELSCERLLLLGRVVPSPIAIHILSDLTVPTQSAEVQQLSVTAKKLGMELIVHAVQDPEQAMRELKSLHASSDHALFRTADPSFASLSAVMGATAREKYIPYIGVNTEEMERCSALFTLDQRGTAYQAAILVDRILNGENPADLPFEVPERRVLGVNLQAAMDLGLVVSPALLEKAQVIIPERERTSLGGRLLLVLFTSSLLIGLIGAASAINPKPSQIAASLGATALVAFGLWVYLQWRIIHPLRRLTTAVEKINLANLDVEIGESHLEDEIGVLGRAFRRMRSNLKYSYSELEKLTNSLQQQIEERIEAYQALQQTQQELETASRRIIEADDSSRFALTTYIHDEVLVLLDELITKTRQYHSSEVEELALSVDQHIRRVRFDLSVPIIQDMEVELRRLLQEILPQFFPQSSHVKLSIDLSGLKTCHDLEPACSVLLYRFVNGAVSNVYRHASANSVSVNTIFSQGMLSVKVCDDGVGFNPATLESYIGDGHYFFHDIAVRSRQLGGSFKVEAEAGKGACLEVIVPVDRDPHRKVNPGGKGNKRKRP